MRSDSGIGSLSTPGATPPSKIMFERVLLGANTVITACSTSLLNHIVLRPFMLNEASSRQQDKQRYSWRANHSKLAAGRQNAKLCTSVTGPSLLCKYRDAMLQPRSWRYRGQVTRLPYLAPRYKSLKSLLSSSPHLCRYDNFNHITLKLQERRL